MSETDTTPEPIDWAGHLERALQTDHDPDSHTEPDAATFHPSQLARCKRQATISKLGLDQHDTRTLGIFQTGTLIHEWLEDQLALGDGVAHEHPVEQTYADGEDTVHVTGRADVYDARDGVVYDFKTRGGWYNFDPPTERHLDQLTLYMDALDADAGQVVYINKKDLEVRPWPGDGTFAFDPDRRDALVEKARAIRDGIREVGVVPNREAVPFEPCGCWLCDQGADDV